MLKLFLICISQIIAEETRIKVKSEEEQASLKAHETQEIADDAQRDLSEALPALVRQRPVLVKLSAIVFNCNHPT